mmetsp:Transcript_26583/g.78968  ORF Transcript_26583/g.78968 Transcript_26583/m.78968 type:complete len:504 (-) Transcript_26583:379-1890(-)
MRRARVPKARSNGNTGTELPPAALTRPVKVVHDTGSVQTVLDQQGAGRVTHQPDGTIVWEPILDVRTDSYTSKSTPLSERALRRLIGLAELAGAISLAMGASVAAASTLVHIDRAYKNGTNLTTGQLTISVANTVASSFAGLTTGLVLGSLRGVAQLARASTRPVILGLVLHRGVRFARNRLRGAHFLANDLSSHSPLERLRALAGIISRAMASEQFRKDFASCSGMTLLLRLLEDCLAEAAAERAAGPGVIPPLLPSTMRALGVLLQNRECVDSCVVNGGVPLILQLLPTCCGKSTSVDVGASPSCSSAAPSHAGSSAAGESRCLADVEELVVSALTCLASVSHTAAGCAAIRCAGGVRAVVSTLSQSALGSSIAPPAVAVLHALGRDTESKAALGEAGAVAALLRATSHEATSAEAVCALHTCVHGCAANQVLLSKEYGASAALRGCSAVRSHKTFRGQADAAALLKILSRFSAETPCHWPAPAGSPLCMATDEYELVASA